MNKAAQQESYATVDLPQSTILSVRRLQKYFDVGDGDVVRAVDDVSFDVRRCETLSLGGESGCGKTTLLRTIAGLERQMSGTVRLGERVLGDGHYFVPPEKRRIGMVFQDYALFPHMTVAENLAFGIPGQAQSASRIEELLKLSLIHI